MTTYWRRERAGSARGSLRAADTLISDGSAAHPVDLQFVEQIEFSDLPPGTPR
jgi:hypothetical protein